jgi:hypothetical protein
MRTANDVRKPSVKNSENWIYDFCFGYNAAKCGRRFFFISKIARLRTLEALKKRYCQHRLEFS